MNKITVTIEWFYLCIYNEVCLERNDRKYQNMIILCKPFCVVSGIFIS
jgi:hypothetical protein